MRVCGQSVDNQIVTDEHFQYQLAAAAISACRRDLKRSAFVFAGRVSDVGVVRVVDTADISKTRNSVRYGVEG